MFERSQRLYNIYTHEPKLIYVVRTTANRRARVRHEYRGPEVREEPDADRRVQVRPEAVRAGAIVPPAHRIRVQGGTDPVQHRQVHAEQPRQSVRSPDQQLDQQDGPELFGDQREDRTR